MLYGCIIFYVANSLLMNFFFLQFLLINYAVMNFFFFFGDESLYTDQIDSLGWTLKVEVELLC